MGKGGEETEEEMNGTSFIPHYQRQLKAIEETVQGLLQLQVTNSQGVKYIMSQIDDLTAAVSRLETAVTDATKALDDARTAATATAPDISAQVLAVSAAAQALENAVNPPNATPTPAPAPGP